MTKLSIIVPCYNEEDNIPILYRSLKETFIGIDIELIFINDGSKDKTAKVLKDLFNCSKENFKFIDFSRNFGKEAAMYAGFKNATGEYIGLIDADMQQNPKVLLNMFNILEKEEEYDSVAAYVENRTEGKSLNFFKKSFYKIIDKMTEIKFVQGASDFRCFRKKVIDSILEMSEYNRFSKGIFTWVGYNTKYIPYKVKARTHGKSSYNFWKLFKYAIDGIVSFSTSPLRVSTMSGLLVSLASFIYLIFVIIQKIFFSIDIPGYATIIVLILLLGGIQLLAIGIIGEYLAKTYLETKKRPIYIAKNIYTRDSKK